MADKIYCYPDTDILINKLDIHNSSQLIEAETVDCINPSVSASKASSKR